MNNKVIKDTSLQDKKKILAESGVIIAIVLFLCYFFGFSYIWNTDYGAEVGVNGWNYIFACITWSFKKTGALYGDIAVPFNYYAKYLTMTLSSIVTVSFALVIALAAISLITSFKYNRKLAITMMILLYVIMAVYLGCIVVALIMNGSRILPEYCSSNPKCSIATLAFFPFFISLLSAILYSVYIHKFKLEEQQN